MLRQCSLIATGVIFAVLALFLATYNLELYPRTWFDEGSHLHVPKVLVQHGVYADLSSEGFRYYGPTTGVGPTVLLPIALVFKLAGIGLLQARLVMAVYLLVAIVLFAAVTRRLHGTTTAYLAAALLVTSPSVNLIYLGRQVLGEVPALAFLMLGILAWLRGIEQDRRATLHLSLAALGFGLAALTKNQFGLLLVPSLLALWLANRIYYRLLTPRFFAFPLLGVLGAMALGYLAQLAIAMAGSGDALETVRQSREASAGAIFVFSPARALSSLKFLASPDVFGFWGIPALVYAAALARERSRTGLQQALLVAFAAVGLAWYAVGSIGWPRYAFPALAVIALFVAQLFYDLIQAFGRALTTTTASPTGRSAAQAFALLSGLALLLLFPLQTQLRSLLTADDRSPQRVAAYLDDHVSRTAIIETWEPELGFLTDHTYHYPPLGWLERAVRSKWLRPDSALTGYDPIAEARPSYLVIGQFGKYTGIYATVIARQPGRIVASIGEYDIWEIWPAP
jgi:4-amino-4-deoxy-L-arabinose transferase-like glycosyltransferase